MTFPNGLFLKPDAWRADKDETPCGALTPMGVHAIDGMIDLCGPIRAGLLPELPARGAGRQRRHDVDAVPDEGRDVGLSRHDDGDGPGLQLPGVRVEGLGAARRHDARGGRLARRNAGRGCSGRASFNRSRARRRSGRRRGSTSRARASRRSRRPPAAARPSRFPLDQMIHGAAVTEAVVRSAASGNRTKRCRRGSRQRSRPPDVLDARASRRRLGAALGLTADAICRR